RLLTTCVRPLWPNTVTMAADAEPADTPRTDRTHAARIDSKRLRIWADDMFGAAVSCRLSCAADPGVVLRRALISVVVLLTAGTVAGCGGGSSRSSNTTAATTGTSTSAQKLLVQTFSGHHTINSGVISLDLRIVPE